jgi:hypothetical protein
MDNWFLRRDKMIRQFTAMSDSHTELLLITIQDLYRMQVEFLEYFEALMADEEKILKKLLKIKLKTIQKFRDETDDKPKVKCIDLNRLKKSANGSEDEIYLDEDESPLQSDHMEEMSASVETPQRKLESQENNAPEKKDE